jgi:hypothetical protein
MSNGNNKDGCAIAVLIILCVIAAVITLGI